MFEYPSVSNNIMFVYRYTPKYIDVLTILYKPNYNPAGIVDPSSTLWKGSWLQSLNLE